MGRNSSNDILTAKASWVLMREYPLKKELKTLYILNEALRILLYRLLYETLKAIDYALRCNKQQTDILVMLMRICQLESI